MQVPLHTLKFILFFKIFFFYVKVEIEYIKKKYHFIDSLRPFVYQYSYILINVFFLIQQPNQKHINNNFISIEEASIVCESCTIITKFISPWL